MYLGARAHSTEEVAFLAGAALAFAEIDWRDPRLLAEQLAALAALQDEHGIAYLAHGPSERNPFDVDEIARVMGPTVCQLLDLAPALGITRYTQHLWLDARFMSAEVIAGKLDLLETWVAHADRAGVVLCIENLSEHADHLAPAFHRLPGLGLTLDLGHGEILSRPNAAFDLIARFPHRIRHVHLHDNHGGTGVEDDLHLPVGAGRVDFAGILRALRATGYDEGFSFEIPLEHVASGCETIREMWDNS
jgi:sugar phosphate isomerase/epimerase